MGGFFKEERDGNVISSSLIDANVPDPKLSGSIILYSSGSIDYRWTIPIRSTQERE